MKVNLRIQKYVEEKKELYNHLLEFLEESDLSNLNFNNLTNFINSKHYLEKHDEILYILRLIVSIANNYHLNGDFFKKIEQIIEYHKDKIKQILSNTEIFDSIKSNKKILLYFLQNEILTLNKSICDEIISKNDGNGSPYCYFFIKEIRKSFGSFIEEERIKAIEDELQRKNIDILDENFDKKILAGENDSYICSLIRNDSIKEFVSYINRSGLSISNTLIENSIFETNSFLLENEEISLIEYSAFFGSIQIFQYLKMNCAELTPKLWLYSIHGRNPEIIHLVESNEIKKLTHNHYIECFCESIKCHHNDFAIYFENNFLNQQDLMNEEVIYSIFKYYNFSYFPVDIDISNCDIFTNLCIYNFDEIVNSLLKDEGEIIDDDKNKLKNIETRIQKAAKENRSDVIYYLLTKHGVIDDFDFNSNKILKKMAIPPSISSINDCSFRCCSSLVQLSIPSTVTMIGSRAFYGCSSLEKIIIPHSVELIGELAFSGCSSLKTIEIPSSVESLGYQAFEDCFKLEQVSIFSQLISFFGCKTFYNCHSLKQIMIPSSVTEIDDNVFDGCNSLTKIWIPSSVTSIGESNFNGVGKLEISGTLKVLPEKMFMKFSKLNEIIFNLSLKSIGFECFYGCNNLTRIVFPSSLICICECAFYNNISLIEIVIPSSVKFIKSGAFNSCKSLENVTFESPSCLTTIDSYVFCECKSLKQITIPPLVTSIGQYAFGRCYSLTDVLFPDSLTVIDKYAFYDCRELKEVTIHNSDIQIGEEAFPHGVNIK